MPHPGPTRRPTSAPPASLIGAWEVRDAQRIGLHHLAVVPCLVLTLMLGPVGLLLYLVLRGVFKKRVWLDEAKATA